MANVSFRGFVPGQMIKQDVPSVLGAERHGLCAMCLPEAWPCRLFISRRLQLSAKLGFCTYTQCKQRDGHRWIFSSQSSPESFYGWIRDGDGQRQRQRRRQIPTERQTDINRGRRPRRKQSHILTWRNRQRHKQRKRQKRRSDGNRDATTYLSVLIRDDDPACLVFSLGVVEVCVEGRSDDDVVQLVPVQVGHTHRVAEVGADLLTGEVEQVPQVAVVQHHLPRTVRGGGSVRISGELSTH